MGQAIGEHLGGFQRRLEEESPGKEELNSCPQTAVFPVTVAGWRKDQRFLLARERLSVTEFPPVVAKLEAGQWSARAAVSVAAGSEQHSDVSSVGQTDLVWLCH